MACDRTGQPLTPIATPCAKEKLGLHLVVRLSNWSKRPVWVMPCGVHEPGAMNTSGSRSLLEGPLACTMGVVGAKGKVWHDSSSTLWSTASRALPLSPNVT